VRPFVLLGITDDNLWKNKNQPSVILVLVSCYVWELNLLQLIAGVRTYESVPCHHFGRCTRPANTNGPQ